MNHSRIGYRRSSIVFNVAVASVLGQALLLLLMGSTQATDSPNILFIGVDDLVAGHEDSWCYVGNAGGVGGQNCVAIVLSRRDGKT